MLVPGGDGEGHVTRACLSASKVRREYGDSSDEQNRLMVEVQEANDAAVHLLNERGYAGKHLKATINKVKLTAPVTVRNSVERVKQLADAKSTSQRFLATGGHHLTGDDFIKSAEFNDRKAKIDLLEGDALFAGKVAGVCGARNPPPGYDKINI